MKLSKSAVRGKARDCLELRFEPQSLTSFAGLIVFQRLFAVLGLKDRLRRCFRHLGVAPLYGHHLVMLVLIVHLLLGYRQLRDVRYYQDDEMVKRVLGLKRLPDVSTLSRTLASADEVCVVNVAALSRTLVLERLTALKPARVTLDFDGSVQSTGRRAEGAAVGYNKKKKGARSYYPLLCTVAQTDQVLDILHRPGNVHDSNGALGFIEQCCAQLDGLPGYVQAEARLDSAFFSEDIIESLDEQQVQFTLSVPHERFAELKELMIAQRRWWPTTLPGTEYFAQHWKPKSWTRAHRFVFVRRRVKVQVKGPLQLDLFELNDYEHEYKVIVTNRWDTASALIRFHEGRGSQEALFGELKSHCQMDYIPVRTRVGNQLYLFATVFAHNLTRELQMQVDSPTRLDCPKRAPLWCFRELQTLRRTFIQRAGRIIRPGGKPTLSMHDNPAVKSDLLHYYEGLARAAA